MAKVKILPGGLSGVIAAPPSKSVAHRAILLAALTKGVSTVGRIDPSDDVMATLGAAAALGAQVERPAGGRVRIIGRNAPLRQSLPLIDCAESGSTLRFLIPATLVLAGGAHFVGRGRLGERPLGPYEDMFRAQGIAMTRGAGNGLDLTVEGTLSPGEFTLPGDVSSQFVSGLLMALPLLGGPSRIHLTGKVESRGYIDMTLELVRQFGGRVDQKDERTFLIPGAQKYRGRDVTVEGDYSQAAVFLCAAALGSDVTVTGLNPLSTQADTQVLRHLMRMGADMVRSADGVQVRAGQLHGAVIDGGQCPDVVPILALVAALAEGESRFVNAGRLRIKESDRLRATCEALNRLGARVEETGGGLVIQGVASLRGGACDCHNDHRIAMLLAIAATRAAGPIELSDEACLKKSYPGFLKDFQALGGRIDV